jgi:hypothetical protein
LNILYNHSNIFFVVLISIFLIGVVLFVVVDNYNNTVKKQYKSTNHRGIIKSTKEEKVKKTVRFDEKVSIKFILNKVI